MREDCVVEGCAEPATTSVRVRFAYDGIVGEEALDLCVEHAEIVRGDAVDHLSVGGDDGR